MRARDPAELQRARDHLGHEAGHRLVGPEAGVQHPGGEQSLGALAVLEILTWGLLGVLAWPLVQEPLVDVPPDLLDLVLAFVIALFLWSGSTAAITSARIRRRLPALEVLGGCCGTDHRHISAISAAWRSS